MPTVPLRRKLEGALASLPVLPQAVVTLMQLDPSSDGYFDEVLVLLEVEPNFATRVLKLANSAKYGNQEPVETLASAMARIGSTGAAELVVALAVTRVFVPRDDWERSLWRHAIQVAVAARELAQRTDDPSVSPETAYVCGLLHDIGRFVMLQEAPETLRRIDEGDWHDPQALVQLEQSICGLTHAELGARACERWKIPATIVQVIRDHHLPQEAEPRGSASKLRALVSTADLVMFPSAMPGTEDLEGANLMTLREIAKHRLPAFLHLSVPELRELLEDATRLSRNLASKLGLD